MKKFETIYLRPGTYDTQVQTTFTLEQINTMYHCVLELRNQRLEVDHNFCDSTENLLNKLESILLSETK